MILCYGCAVVVWLCCRHYRGIFDFDSNEYNTTCRSTLCFICIFSLRCSSTAYMLYTYVVSELYIVCAGCDVSILTRIEDFLKLLYR